jgi:hypothetical protein
VVDELMGTNIKDIPIIAARLDIENDEVSGPIAVITLANGQKFTGDAGIALLPCGTIFKVLIGDMKIYVNTANTNINMLNIK